MRRPRSQPPSLAMPSLDHFIPYSALPLRDARWHSFCFFPEIFCLSCADPALVCTLGADCRCLQLLFGIPSKLELSRREFVKQTSVREGSRRVLTWSEQLCNPSPFRICFNLERAWKAGRWAGRGQCGLAGASLQPWWHHQMLQSLFSPVLLTNVGQVGLVGCG